jgi:hypothetical protein
MTFPINLVVRQRSCPYVQMWTRGAAEEPCTITPATWLCQGMI